MTSWFARAVRGLLAILAEQIPSSANDQNNSIVKERAPRSVTGDVENSGPKPDLVEPGGIEPPTSCLQSRRSPD